MEETETSQWGELGWGSGNRAIWLCRERQQANNYKMMFLNTTEEIEVSLNIEEKEISRR